MVSQELKNFLAGKAFSGLVRGGNRGPFWFNDWMDKGPSIIP